VRFTLVLGDDLQVPLYLPNRHEVASIAQRAELRNPNPDARLSISAKIAQPPTDWDRRTILSVPGIVWSVSSDTCATGRLSAPDNIAYDHDYREFVYRQPNTEAELAAIMSADSEEVFACYRFDGLSRWTHPAFGAWLEDLDVVLGYVRHTLDADPEPELRASRRRPLIGMSGHPAVSQALAGLPGPVLPVQLGRQPGQCLGHPFDIRSCR
jgi:hypothetical protein